MARRNKDWRSSSPGATAAEEIKERLDRIAEQIRAGQLDVVREDLIAGRWAANHDWSVIPPQIARATHRQMDDVIAALRAGDTAGALRVVEDARAKYDAPEA